MTVFELSGTSVICHVSSPATSSTVATPVVTTRLTMRAGCHEQQAPRAVAASAAPPARRRS